MAEPREARRQHQGAKGLGSAALGEHNSVLPPGPSDAQSECTVPNPSLEILGAHFQSKWGFCMWRPLASHPAPPLGASLGESPSAESPNPLPLWRAAGLEIDKIQRASRLLQAPKSQEGGAS